MSFLPLRGMNAQSPAPPHRPRWIWGLAAGLIVYSLYSGLVWNWFRPLIHKDLINRYAADNHLDPLWIMAIVKVESGFAPNARSARGAVGLMQLLPSTARELALEVGLAPFQDSDLTRPDVNLRLGSHYLAKLRREFPDDDIAVLAAYNAGPGVTHAWRRGEPALEIDEIPYPETRRFVRQVQSAYNVLKIFQTWKRSLWRRA